MARSSVNEWDEYWKQVGDGGIVLSSSTLQTLVAHIRHKITHLICGESTQADASVLLDNESTSDVSQQLPHISDGDSDITLQANDSLSFDSYAGVGSNPTQPLILKVKKKVGRASIYRRRAKYFQKCDVLMSQEETDARKQRSEEANYRKAYRAAADEAMASNCYTWTTLTFDDLHRSDKPQEVFQCFLRRLRERYKRKTGKPLKYVAVIGYEPDGREHVHSLFSEDVDHQDIVEAWREGVISKIVSINHDEVETKVGYMGDHVSDGRVTFGRFIHSRSTDESDVSIPVEGVSDGRVQLEELIHPHRPRVVESRLFGQFARITFRFPPLRSDDDGELEDEEESFNYDAEWER
jgi:hypothetical protein